MLQTPEFTAENNVEKQREIFRKFLFHIFDQPVESAFRRNRFYWGSGTKENKNRKWILLSVQKRYACSRYCKKNYKITVLVVKNSINDVFGKAFCLLGAGYRSGRACIIQILGEYQSP